MIKRISITAIGLITTVAVLFAGTPITNLILKGNMDAGAFRITNLGAPSASADAATKGYTDTGLAGRVSLTGSYSDPAWLTSLGWTKLTGKPTTLSGFGITDAQPLDGDLTSIAALSTTTFGRSLLTQADAPAVRSLIGLGGAALLNVGTTTGTVAAGDDSRIVNAVQTSGSYSNPTWISSLAWSKVTGVPSASTSTAGVVQIATLTDAQTGSDSAKALVSSVLSAWWTWIKTQAHTWAGTLIFTGGISTQSASEGLAEIKAINTADVATGIKLQTGGTSGPAWHIRKAASGESHGLQFNYWNGTSWQNNLMLLTTSGNFSNSGNFTAGDSASDLFQVFPANPTAQNAYTWPSWPGTSGSPSSTTLTTRDAVRNDILDPNFFAEREEFGSGGSTTGTIGKLGWNLNGSGGIENAGGISSLGGGIHLRTTQNTITSSLSILSISLGGAASFTGAGYLSNAPGTDIRMVSVVKAPSSSIAWSVCAGRDGLPASFTKITPPTTAGVRYIPYSQSAWAATTAKVVGNSVRPTTSNGLKYICTTAGATGSSEPTWPTTIGGTVTDGTVTWTCAGADGNASGFIEFFVTGANAETTIATALSSIVGTDAGTKTIRIRFSAMNLVYFSVNGESEQSIAMPGTAFPIHPSFNTRNDGAVTYPDFDIYMWACKATGVNY